MSNSRLESSNIKTEIEDRNRLQEDLMELSTQVMGTDVDGAAKNHSQIIAVIQALFNIQQSRKQLELANSTNTLNAMNLEEILSVTQLLKESAYKFDYLVARCLSSFSSYTQELAAEYLENLKTLFAASNTAINKILAQRYQSLQATTKDHTQIGPQRNTSEQAQPNHQQKANQIQQAFNASHQRASELVKKLENAPWSSSETLTAKDEANYWRNEILDTIDIEMATMKALAKNLDKQLSYANTPIGEHERVLKSTQAQIANLAKTHAALVASATHQEASVHANFNIPARPYIPANIRTKKIKRQTKNADSDDTAVEKKTLLDEISRIKAQIQKMTNNLTNEIPKAVFSKGLKTYKRDKLLTLSRELYVSTNPSLEELRVCVKKFQENLEQCQKDAKLRQGIIRKNCRTLIDSLTTDLDNPQHIFRHKKK